MYSLYFKAFLLESLFCNLNPPVTLDKSRFMNHEVGLDFITVPRRLEPNSPGALLQKWTFYVVALKVPMPGSSVQNLIWTLFVMGMHPLNYPKPLQKIYSGG